MSDQDQQADDVEVAEAADRQRWEATIGGEVAGYAEYERAGGVVTFTHTVVDDAYEGRGVGSRLAAAALDAARAAGDRVVPRCAFIADYIDRHAEYADLVDTSS